MKSLNYEDLPDRVYRDAQRGDLTAQEAVVRHHQGPVRAWIAAHCPAGADADDIAQRTFLAALERIDMFEIGTRFRAWLFTIARYQVMTETSRLRRHADYHSRYAPELLAAELERRARESKSDEDLRVVHLRDCVEGLEDHLKQFVNWRYTDRIPLADMAERTGRSVPAIKKQLWLIRKTLQTCIDTKMTAQSGGIA
ncbi:MAG: sigma-70 family RNA polymerase sigma factor [Verrucomicrobiota bacterium]